MESVCSPQVRFAAMLAATLGELARRHWEASFRDAALAAEALADAVYAEESPEDLVGLVVRLDELVDGGWPGVLVDPTQDEFLVGLGLESFVAPRELFLELRLSLFPGGKPAGAESDAA